MQASRAQILKKAAEYIQFMRRKNNSHQQDIDDLKRQNGLLEAQSEIMQKFQREVTPDEIIYLISVRTLERARASGSFDNSEALENNIKSDMSSHESTDNENEVEDSRRNKRMKTSSY